ncbi:MULTISPECIES: peptidoglycan D,D-transpeptidase FtsI family protein [Sphingomonas]|uniref:Peptidoglycan glycosyltransferase n=2 Tax=Sphingomonas TaxID=13687 RepID=A0A175Y706_9SPHN|nr:MULTISPECIES: penicillin-binding protein 2 [Sphingomonas]ANC85987.1 peptidoglycan glycosyltransferase [Sphingomonas sp. NIC1]AOW24254.1 peptidoglycan glycosyltransferase [Sphingomonas melonis TY]ATI55306.1 penicillin-binding protein 2 [Sphingomonas melonis]KZB96338.1 peptidoglycan glycosyltransferase [Sphingomonas melonis TY]MBB3875795.1 cell division protein FtsI (penicillin-binding protein 3) [Sphingomonas aquatilis]
MTVIVARPAQAQHRSAGQRHALVATSHMRLMMLMMLFAAAVVLIIGRLAMLGILSGGEAAARTAALAARGDIVDRNGAPLARTIDAWTIAVHPNKIIGDKMEIAARLAALMPDRGDQAWFYHQLTRNISFVYLQRRASPALVEQVNAIGEPALVFARETQRLYPQSTMAAHALGFLSTDGHGMSGMERVLDERLLDPAQAGKPVALAIDARVQAAMESELGRAMGTFSARGAGGIVMDVHTGEVLAMVSLPTFNPNRVGMAGSEELRNLTTQSVFELGSTFKPITVATAIDTGTITMNRKFDATHPLKVGGFTIHDERGDPQRWLSMPETLIYSSNIATARIADEVGPQKMQTMFRKLGFDTRPDIELREKGRPLWPRYWARTTTMTTAYGHGIAVTPLHLASAYAALVNGGIWRPATLMKIAPGQAPAGRRVISEATSYKMRQMLRLIVMRGTGRKGDAPGYRVGGKTGTAEAAVAGGYDHSRNVATFAAAFPMDAPKYVVLAMLDSPQGTKETGGWKTAAWNAAPVVGRTIARVGSMLGVVPDAQRDIDVADMMPLIWQETPPKQANGN